ncbi:hypothetical protein [Mycetocola sp.]|uniref:hypothetical protein n=1 Tax=Mycetocola sp. TaxID=1871042 RepID=UPI003988D0C1
MAATVALIGWPVWAVLTQEVGFEQLLPIAVAYPVVVVGAGVIGKLFGMYRPRTGPDDHRDDDVTSSVR